MSYPKEAIRYLKNYREQLDEYGVNIAVSRQALDELLNYVENKPIIMEHIDQEEVRILYTEEALERFFDNRDFLDWERIWLL